MNDHIAAIENIVADFLKNNGKFPWNGTEFDLRAELNKGEAASAATLEALTSIIYSRYYAVNPLTAPRHYNPNDPAFIAQTNEFVKYLSVNNLTTARTDAGWTVEAVLTNGQVRAYKNGSSLVLEYNQYEATHPSTQLTPGAIVTRKILKESTELQPVFYYAFSDAHFLHTPKIMRFYWNINPNSSASLLKEISYHLNEYRVPYLFKCLNNPAYYDRRDSAVLYVTKQYHAIINKLLPVIYERNATAMVDDIPLFSLKLATGLGYADSPVSGDSFGMHRSRIIARGIIAAAQKNTFNNEDNMKEISAQFAKEHIDPSAPYIVKDSKKVITPFSA